MNPNLAKIFIYPIKSLDGVALDRVTILKSGAIARDRQWALIDEKGRFVNGKSNYKIHLLRSHFNLDFKTITLQIEGQEEKYHFNLETEKIALESWLSKYFNLKVKLVENDLTGFPDDTNANGPTIISTETIKEIASWYSDISVEEMRSRLRANLEINGVPAFWEDRLFDREDMPKKFKIGEVLFNGINPCQRCIVPTRNSQ
ncbi:MAG: MOSC N-terminal beta barrel domain-containing protein, partial [Prochloraceae cyanobacterium]|nr:MOSC N-terminal beta barrel domain-containing protein [Prochloraceae cyanobacterium]